MDGHCIHFPDFEPGTVRCTVCIHGLPEARPPKPDDWFLAPSSGAVIDPGDALIEGVMAGTTCPVCMTSRSPIGCSCSRTQVGVRDLDAACTFLEQAVEATDFTVKEAGGFAQSVAKRVLRRVELTDEEADDTRQGIRAQFSVEPKWFAPRTTEPTHLPV